MKSVGCAPIACAIAFPEGRAIEGAVLLTKAPTVTEIVLRSRAAQLRLLGAVDIEEIVSLPVPAAGHVINTLDRSNIMAASLQVGEKVISAHHTRVLLAVGGREVGGLSRQLLVFLPINIEVKSMAALLALVGHRNPRRFLKGHGPITI